MAREELTELSNAGVKSFYWPLSRAEVPWWRGRRGTLSPASWRLWKRADVSIPGSRAESGEGGRWVRTCGGAPRRAKDGYGTTSKAWKVWWGSIHGPGAPLPGGGLAGPSCSLRPAVIPTSPVYRAKRPLVAWSALHSYGLGNAEGHKRGEPRLAHVKDFKGPGMVNLLYLLTV